MTKLRGQAGLAVSELITVLQSCLRPVMPQGSRCHPAALALQHHLEAFMRLGMPSEICEGRCLCSMQPACQPTACPLTVMHVSCNASR